MSDRIRLTKNFYLDEFTRSETAARHGIEILVGKNTDVYDSLLLLCRHVLQPLRDALGPVHVISGYRPPKVNRLAKGSKTSAHIDGFAADIVVTGYTPKQVANWIRKNVPGFDQVILEYGLWVHVAINPSTAKPRRQALTAVKVKRLFRKPKTVYVSGLLAANDARRLAGVA